MSLTTIAECSRDQAFTERVIACTVAEAWNNAAVADNTFTGDVQASAENGRRMVYPTAVASDVEAAYASALAAGNPNPGGDPSVITDGMILANVQAKWPADPTP
ncbi:MAG TPA: hypothetical protein VJN72_06280 [Gaiellales bacterium]|nr:hypothetical protein [Gaiellales bacterium]